MAGSAWLAFWITFVLLCLREGARVQPDNKAPVSRFLRFLWRVFFRVFAPLFLKGKNTMSEEKTE